MDLAFAPVTLAAIEAERRTRWGALPAQEYFLEAEVQRGRAHAVRRGGAHAGYAVVGAGRTLVEVHAAGPVARPEEIALAAVRDLGVDRVWCLTFDPLAAALPAALGVEPRPIGVSFREYRRRPPPPHRFDAEVAGPSDLATVLELDDSRIFESEDEASEWVARGRVVVFRQDARPVGFGVVTPVLPFRSESDVGMLVARDLRGQGYGAAFARHLAERALADGRVPVCGCGIENVPSWRSLERAGFVADHRLLELEVPRRV